MIKLFATDIDHTMYCHELGYIPEENFQAIEKLLEKGVVVCLASSRMISGVQKEVDRLKLKERNGYVSVNNGAYTIRLSDNKVLTDEHFSEEEIDQLYQIAMENKVNFAIAQSDNIVTTGFGEIYKYDFEAVGIDIIVTNDFRKYKKENIYQLSFGNDAMNMYQFCTEMQKKYGDQFNFNVPQSTCTDVSKKGVTKLLGVEAIAKDLGITMDEVACVGDNDNDAPMLEKARLSACVANGSEYAKQCAKVVVKSDREAGVAQFINEYVLPEVK